MSVPSSKNSSTCNLPLKKKVCRKVKSPLAIKKAAIKSSIDWEYVNELKKDPLKFHNFLQIGKKMVDLVSVLHEVDSRP